MKKVFYVLAATLTSSFAFAQEDETATSPAKENACMSERVW